jgi:hypothetical protein
MSNIILPLSHIDFTATIAELTPYLENNTMNLPSPDWSEVSIVLADESELPVTSAALSQLNASILTVVYLERQGGIEHYQASRNNSCIIIPLESSGSTIAAYSTPYNSPRREDFPNAYHKDDCTLISSHSLDEPVFTGSEIEGADLVYSFQVPEGILYKSLIIFINESTITI